MSLPPTWTTSRIIDFVVFQPSPRFLGCAVASVMSLFGFSAFVGIRTNCHILVLEHIHPFLVSHDAMNSSSSFHMTSYCCFLLSCTSSNISCAASSSSLVFRRRFFESPNYYSGDWKNLSLSFRLPAIPDPKKRWILPCTFHQGNFVVSFFPESFEPPFISHGVIRKMNTRYQTSKTHVTRSCLCGDCANKLVHVSKSVRIYWFWEKHSSIRIENKLRSILRRFPTPYWSCDRPSKAFKTGYTCSVSLWVPVHSTSLRTSSHVLPCGSTYAKVCAWRSSHPGISWSCIIGMHSTWM